MDRRPAFTVFTATYNRAHTLRRAYDSLRAQTFRDFEWLIVDDGSNDGTEDHVRRWTSDAGFELRYVQQPNQGKHVAFNRGVAAARGELFLSLDSDDACVPHALERFMWHWERIPAEQRDRFTGVTALCMDQDGRAVGTPFPRDVLDSDSCEIRYRYKVAGDKWGFHRTDVLRRHPFPELPGVKFVPEAIVWRAIARSYRTRYVNEPLRIYWRTRDAGAQLTTTRPTGASLSALALLHRSILNDDLRWFRHAPVSILRSAVNYSRFSFGSGVGVAEQSRRLRAAAQPLWLMALPLGLAASVRDRAGATHR